MNRMKHSTSPSDRRLKTSCGFCCNRMGTTGSAKPWRRIVNTTARAAFSEASPIREPATLLKRCGRPDCEFYLATSKRETFASRILHHLGFATYFDGIHGSVPGGGLDHKPELLAHILSRHSLLPSHSLMVGDRRHDISGAHAVGMRGLGVLWGYGSRDELEAAGADQLVESTADLARTVLSMVSGKQSPSGPGIGLMPSRGQE